MRSSNGPDSFSRYRAMCAGLQLQCLFLSPKNPQGHGLSAATSKNEAGKANGVQRA